MSLPSLMKPSMEELLDEWTRDAATLRKHGQDALAQQLDTVVARIREVADEWLDTLSEGEASLYSGQSTRWLSQRFASYARRGLAFRRGRARMYRRCALPRRPDLTAAYAAGQEAARLSRASGQ
ncbi:hypothetical protein [Gemmatimonas sp.]